MSRGPLPSELCLLSSLPRRKVDDKVRFLGCVTAYSTSTACLTLGHLYPRGTDVSVRANVELLLETLAAEATHTGEWVNVVGYVTSVGGGTAAVQALMVWPAGPMDVQQYEAALEDI